MSAARLQGWAASLALGCAAVACGHPEAPNQVQVEPPRNAAAIPGLDPPSAAADDRGPVEVPRDKPGGQSGSMGSSIGCTTSMMRTVALNDASLRGYTLAELHAWLRAQYAQPIALFWHVGTRVPATVELSFELAAEAKLTRYGLESMREEEEVICAYDDSVEQSGTLRIRSSDGLLAAEVATEVVFTGLDFTRGPRVKLRNLIALDELGAPLRDAIVEALTAVGAPQAYAGISIEPVPSAEDDGRWELALRLVPEHVVEDGGVMTLALGRRDVALPAERIAVAPSAELAAECERGMQAAAQVAPATDAPAFDVVAGSWLLCDGDYPASVRVEHAGIRIDRDGGFALLGLDGGELVEQQALGQAGRLEFWDPDRYSELVRGSGLQPAPPLPGFMPLRMVGELLLQNSGAYGGLRGLRGLLVPESDGRTLRAGPLDPSLDPPNLRYVRTELPVRPAAAPQWAAGEAAGMAGCNTQQSTRLAVDRDAQRLTGSFAICGGGLRGATRLALEPGGRFRAHDAAGELVWQGAYAVVTDPVMIYSGDSRGDLVLTDDEGTRDVLGVVAVSERPYTLLVSAHRPADFAWAPDRFALLSPEP